MAYVAMNMDSVDSMKTVLDQIALPPPICKFEGDANAEDSPLRVWLVSPAQYNKFAAQPGFRSFQSAAFGSLPYRQLRKYGQAWRTF